MAQTENPSKLTVSGYFLYLVSDAFFKELTQLPELEFARDKIKVAPSQECVDRLLQATPYAIGTEFINEQWIREMFVQLEMGNDKILPDVGVVVSNGTWLSHMLLDLREPGRMRSAAVPKSLHATLRPYQKSGYSWLNYMNQLGFGACLADDMGLGKTVQVLAYLEKMRKSNKNAKILLVVPASLIGNWQREKEKFAPDME